jgi:soluble lytic murein transglycosylase-like protein
MVENNILRHFCFAFVWMPVFVSHPGFAAPLTSVVRADPHSGKLVRVMVPGGSAQKAPELKGQDPGISAAVEQAAAEHELPAELIRSVIQVESNYNPFAVSPKGALGMMQLIPETARRFGVSDAFNPVENIRGGAKYLRHLLDLYHGDYGLALAAYNAGEGAVAKHGGAPPYPETRKYVESVQKHFTGAVKNRTGKPAPQGIFTVGAEASTPQYNQIHEIVEPDGSVRYVSQ